MHYNGLELYASIEDMLDFSETVEKLYGAFYKKLKTFNNISTVLDIGCGSGAFGLGLLGRGYRAQGIDLSQKMVENSISAGFDAKAVDLCEVKEKFDAATAVFDVLNYLDKDGLKNFFGCVGNILNSGGYFLADLNTEYGFSVIAPGVISFEDDERYVVLDAEYEDRILTTNINVFEKQVGGLYDRKEGEIIQHYHTRKDIESITDLKLVECVEIGLYGKKPDKLLYVFKKS